MIGQLPTSVTVGEQQFDIRWDFRDCLNILLVFSDVELKDYEKWQAAIIIFYPDYLNIKPQDYEEAAKQMQWFLNLGGMMSENGSNRPLYDWEQDEQIIFAAVNRVAGFETRTTKELHFWTFMDYFFEIGEGTFASFVSIRNKLSRNKKLDKWDMEFYKNNKKMIDIKEKLTQQEKDERERINALLNS